MNAKDLEPLARALIAELQHGAGSRTPGGMKLQDCRWVWRRPCGAWPKASEILLIAAGSMRQCGRRRFAINRAGASTTDIRIEAGPRSDGSVVTRVSADQRSPRAATATRGAASDATKSELDGQLDAYHGRQGPAEKTEENASPQGWNMTAAKGWGVYPKTKRPRGGR